MQLYNIIQTKEKTCRFSYAVSVPAAAKFPQHKKYAHIEMQHNIHYYTYTYLCILELVRRGAVRWQRCGKRRQKIKHIIQLNWERAAPANAGGVHRNRGVIQRSTHHTHTLKPLLYINEEKKLSSEYNATFLYTL